MPDVTATLFDPDNLTVHPVDGYAPPLRPDQQHVYDALLQGPATAAEVVTRLANRGVYRQQNCVAKRLSELGPGTKDHPGLDLIERTGVERVGTTGRAQHEWRIKP